jgi:hypothetical protein
MGESQDLSTCHLVAVQGDSLELGKISCLRYRRICLGQQFALTEAGYVIVRLLQRFDKIDGRAMAELPIHWILTVTGRPKYGVNVRLHEANED